MSHHFQPQKYSISWTFHAWYTTNFYEWRTNLSGWNHICYLLFVLEIVKTYTQNSTLLIHSMKHVKMNERKNTYTFLQNKMTYIVIITKFCGTWTLFLVSLTHASQRPSRIFKNWSRFKCRSASSIRPAWFGATWAIVFNDMSSSVDGCELCMRLIVPVP